MNRLRAVSLAFVCAACTALSTGWAADNAPADSGTSGQPADIQQLKTQLEQQQKQIEQLQKTLEAQQKALEKATAAAADKAASAPREAPAAPPAEPDHKMPNLGEVASTRPIIPRGVATTVAVSDPGIPIPQGAQTVEDIIPESPLQLRIGFTTITPVGFMDLTNTFRSTNSGAGFATNFGNYPYNNVIPGGRLTEDRFQAGNSRIGFRADSVFKGFHVLGYFESDFVGGVGNAAFNTQVTSNSILLRMRLYWVNVRKGAVEFQAGQSWSLMTPNRNGLSALPGDLFYGQEFDVNYLNGLTWGRIPGLRLIYHAGKVVTMGFSAENAAQYFGGSGGGGVPTLPSALNIASFQNQLDGGFQNGFSVPNVAPDLIAKIAFQPSSRVHVEVAGVADFAKVINPLTNKYFSKTGGGGSINGNFEVVKNLRLITNNFWSDGAGRYLFGAVPNFIVRADGSLSMMHAGSTLDGFEARLGKTQLYGYYGGIYAGRNVALDTNGTPIGYGYFKSPNSQNRTMQEGTIGITQTFFNNPRYGAVSMYLDYAYFWRNPWYYAAGQAGGKNAKQNAVWFDLRYTLPGSAPTITY
jgi:hypothetical protein